jgi:ABC-2 type transport system ATP-binding protein
MQIGAIDIDAFGQVILGIIRRLCWYRRPGKEKIMDDSLFAIKTQGLTKHFGRRPAVESLDLCVPRGTVFGFLGRNGAGKTTTIGMLVGLLRPTEGRAWLLGHDVAHDLRNGLRRSGVMLDRPAFYPYLTARENLWVVAQALGDGATARIEPVLHTVELADRAADRFGSYSAGMKQRLGLAAALLNDPELLILDEPTTGLDPVGQRDTRLLIRHLANETGKTIFLSSHQLTDVAQICDQVAIIDRGRLIAQGPLAEVAAGRDLETAFMQLAGIDDSHAAR